MPEEGFVLPLGNGDVSTGRGRSFHAGLGDVPETTASAFGELNYVLIEVVRRFLEVRRKLRGPGHRPGSVRTHSPGLVSDRAP
jgi:hypothetical protein